MCAGVGLGVVRCLRRGGCRLLLQVETAGEQQGVGAQPDDQDEGGQRVGGSGEEEGTGERGDAECVGEVAGGGGEVGADDAAEGGGDQDGGHGAGAVGGCGEVGSGVAGLEVGGGARTVDEQGDEQQDGVVGDGGGDDSGTAYGAGEVSGGQAGAAASGLGYAADGDGGEGGACGEQGAGQAREVGGAEHVLREQRADGDAGREPGPAEGLGRGQDGEDAALGFGLGGHAGVRGWGGARHGVLFRSKSSVFPGPVPPAGRGGTGPSGVGRRGPGRGLR